MQEGSNIPILPFLANWYIVRGENLINRTTVFEDIDWDMAVTKKQLIFFTL